MDLSTVFPPMPTPFRDGEVDADAIRFNVRRWMTAGLGGVLALGTNGEAPLLDDAESDRVLETARQEVPRHRVLIAGVGRESTRATIAAARRAGALGADAVLVRTPSIYRAHVSQDALSAHYAAVADSSPVPVLLYNFPASTGVALTADLVARLAVHPNVIGIKQTSTDGAEFAELSGVVPPEFAILAGSAPGAYTAFCAGAIGAIVALACVLPEPCLMLLQLTRTDRHAEALALQQHLTPLARTVTSGFGIPGLKAAMDYVGYRGGEPRAPLSAAGADALARIGAVVDAARASLVSRAS
ncbi:MAG TPA: dihydrodipicolinate synthase family protein [Vicinamibacterales bacterium]|jgi:4-hydroxy-2-oxoglutarate aldolase